MSGKNILLDTNNVLYALADTKYLKKLKEHSLYLSFITELELLSYPAISENDGKTIQYFISKTTIIDINASIKENTIDLRKKYKLKLPDAIIAATSLTNNLILFTSDKDLFKIVEITVKNILTI